MDEDSHAPGESPRSGDDGAWFDLGFHTVMDDGGLLAQFEQRSEKAGDRVGPYQLVTLLGEGGFGRVWQAMQTEPIRRELALKLIKPGMDSREIIARFEAESRALAMMDHPNIAAVIDAGTSADGRLYFAMELVRGAPITTYCDSRKLDVRERLELFLPVCHAIQHAHQKSILHRDLKPSNILVVEVDGKPVPKVIDFGIAKALGSEEGTCPASSLLLTRFGMVIGTPEYMSPEQAGSVPDVDTRSDIYSLGIVLFEMLTARTPLAVGERTMAIDDWLQRVRKEDPVRPSTCYQADTEGTRRAAANRGTEPGRMKKVLHGDLDWIVLKALEKDRQRRYETATGLAKDLERYLENQPVSAVAPSWSYQFGKFALRNRGVLIAGTTICVALVAGTVVSLWQAARATHASEKAEQSRQEAVAARVEAEANYRNANEAVNRYFNSITDNANLKDGEFASLRSSLLQWSLPYYEQAAAKRGSDPALRLDQCRALGRLAVLEMDRGQNEKALAHYREAVAIGRELCAAQPGVAINRRSLGLECNNLAILLNRLGQHEEAVAMMQEGVALQDSLTLNDVGLGDYGREEGLVLTNLGDTFQQLGKLDQAEHSYRRSIDIQEHLLKIAPDSPGYLLQLSASQAKLAGLLCNRGEGGEGESLYRQAIKNQERVVELDVDSTGHRGILAATCRDFAVALNGLKKYAEAEDYYRKGLAVHQRLLIESPRPANRYAVIHDHYDLIFQLIRERKLEEAEELNGKTVAETRQLVTDCPDGADYANMLGILYRVHGNFQRDHQSWERARELYESAIEVHRKAISLNLHWDPYRVNLLEDRQDLLRMLMFSGDVEGAERYLAEVLAGDSAWQVQAWGAEQFLILATDAAGRIPFSPEAGFLMSHVYTMQALDTLRGALDSGCPEREKLLSRTTLGGLRDQPEFQQLAGPGLMASFVPRRFTQDYKFDDPGTRLWTCADGIWTETRPSGKKSTFRIVGRVTTGSIPGTEIERIEGQPDHLLIPDKDIGGKLMLRTAGRWVSLGTVANVE